MRHSLHTQASLQARVPVPLHVSVWFGAHTPSFMHMSVTVHSPVLSSQTTANVPQLPHATLGGVVRHCCIEHAVGQVQSSLQVRTPIAPHA